MRIETYFLGTILKKESRHEKVILQLNQLSTEGYLSYLNVGSGYFDRFLEPLDRWKFIKEATSGSLQFVWHVPRENYTANLDIDRVFTRQHVNVLFAMLYRSEIVQTSFLKGTTS